MGSERKTVTLSWEPVELTLDEFAHGYLDHMKSFFNTKKYSLDGIIDLEKAGLVRQLVARVDGEPAGYYVAMISPCPYDKKVKWAQDLGIYVFKEYRGLGLSKKMSEVVEDRLRQEGVEKLITAFPKKVDSLLESGYELTEYVYSKELV